MANKAPTSGFTLMETVVCVAIAALGFAVSMPSCMRLVQAARLHDTARTLTCYLRYAQQLAQENGQFAAVRLAPYSPYFQLYSGTRCLQTVPFLPGVNYKDGYLQLNTGNIVFDLLGNAQVGGAIRLVSGADEQDVRLYIGAGLVAGG